MSRVIAGDHAVGYGRPPKDKRFKPGQSGNPRGRPKGAKNMQTLLQEAGDERVWVTVNGKRRLVSKRKITVAQLWNKASQGDLRAAEICLKHEASNAPKQESEPAEVAALSDEDEALLAKLRKRESDDGY